MKAALVSISMVFFLTVAPCQAIDFSVGNKADLLSEKGGWFPTGENNGLEKDRTLFQFLGRGTRRTLNTVSESTNIHDHFKRGGAGRLKNYVYTGQMQVADAGGGIGVTLYSKYPLADRYYRLRRIPNASFEISPHGTVITEGDTDLGVTPEPGAWYNFKVSIKSSRKLTSVRAKVWKAGTRQPRLWQAICIDESETRIQQGAPGVWSMGSDLKSWRRLTVRRR